MSTLHVLSRHTLHFFFFWMSAIFIISYFFWTKSLTHIYTPSSTIANMCQNPLYPFRHSQVHHSHNTTQHNCFILFYFISMKTIATSSLTNTLSVTSIYQIKLAKHLPHGLTQHILERAERGLWRDFKEERSN